MTILPLQAYNKAEKHNPLDAFEDLLEASSYDFDRVSVFRLHFRCSGKQGDYLIMVEWNADACLLKCSLVIESTKNIATDILQNHMVHANEQAWHGFFVTDGVGHSIFKSVMDLSHMNAEQSMFGIEDMIDKAVEEADRFTLSLSIIQNTDTPLFPQDDDLETLSLMFADIKGSA